MASAATQEEEEEGEDTAAAPSFSLLLVMDLYMTSCSIPTSLAHTFLQFYDPKRFPRNLSSPADQLCLRIIRGLFVRRLQSHIADPSKLSLQTLTTIKELHSPIDPNPNPIAPALLLTLASYLTCSSSDFSKSFQDVFQPEIKPILDQEAKGLISDPMHLIYHRFASAQSLSERNLLRIHWGRVDRVVELLKKYVNIEWEQMGPPLFKEFVDAVSGQNAVDYWKQTDAASRERLFAIVGKTRASQILENVDPPPPPAAAKIVVDVDDSTQEESQPASKKKKKSSHEERRTVRKWSS